MQLKALRDRIANARVRERIGPAVPSRTGELEVDQWVISDIVLRRIAPAVGVRPFPLNELMLMVSAVAWFMPTHIFEWGTNVGASARVFHEAARALGLKVEIHSTDLPDHVSHVEHPHEARGRLVRGLSDVQLHEGDGLTTSLELVRRMRPQRMLFFVDGDHAHESVYGELVAILGDAPGAAVLIHDTFWQHRSSGYNVGPHEAVRQVVAKRPEYTAFSPDLGVPGMTLLYRSGPCL